MSVCGLVAKDLANCKTDMVLLYSKASYRCREGLYLDSSKGNWVSMSLQFKLANASIILQGATPLEVSSCVWKSKTGHFQF